MLTKEGFKRKTLVEFAEEMQEQARELFGADVNLSDRSPLGQWIMLIAYGRAQENMLAEQVWLSGHVEDAEGVSLDHNAKRISLTRIQEQPARGEVTFVVDPGLSVASGMIVATTDGLEFVTTAGGTDTVGAGSITVPIEAMQPGISGNVPANTIIEINTPAAGITGVTNAKETQDGANVESDTEFRERYFRSLANAGGASTPSVEAALLQLPGVIDAIVSENDSEIEVDGLPPNSIAPFVHGGNDEDIASAIFYRKSGGIRSFGSTEVVVTDTRSRTHRIGFSRPTVVPVWVRLTIVKNSEFGQDPSQGDALVKTRIVQHIGGLDADGQRYDGQGLGADVIRYKLIGAIGGVPGIDDVSIEVSTDGITYGQNNVAIDSVSIAQTDSARVVIE